MCDTWIIQVEVPSFLQNSFLGNKNNKVTSSSSSQNAFLNPPAFLQLGLDRTGKGRGGCGRKEDERESEGDRLREKLVAADNSLLHRQTATSSAIDDSIENEGWMGKRLW